MTDNWRSIEMWHPFRGSYLLYTLKDKRRDRNPENEKSIKTMYNIGDETLI